MGGKVETGASKELSPSSRTVPQDFLSPPPERRYVRSFLFTRRVNAPFVQVHLLARLLLVLCLSGALLRTINTTQPDLLGAILFWLVALLVFLLSGVSPRVARFYFLLTLPALVALFITWIVFNPVAGGMTLAQLTIYSGQLSIGLAPWQAVLIAIVALYFLWTRKLFLGIVVGLVVAFALAHWVALPALMLTEIHVFH
nr:hypothetical protein [Ktedonobacteraceae bacterium]